MVRAPNQSEPWGPLPAAPAPMSRTSPLARLDLLALLGILAIAAKTAIGVERIRDIGLDDETVYLASGVWFGRPGFPNTDRGLPPAENGPLYSLWYRALSLFQPD